MEILKGDDDTQIKGITQKNKGLSKRQKRETRKEAQEDLRKSTEMKKREKVTTSLGKKGGV